MAAQVKGPRNVLLLSGDPGIPLYGPSGSSAHVRGIARALISLGHRVRIAIPRLHDHRGTVDDLIPATVITADRPPKLRWPGLHRETALARHLVKLALDGFEPDLIWERYSLWSDAGVRAASARKTRHLLEVNAPLSIERDNPGLEQSVIRNAGEIVAVSAALAGWARELGAQTVRHIANGTDISGPGDRDATRARLALQGTVLGFVGSMKPWHGLAGIPMLLDALPDATALLVGTGPAPVPVHARIRHVGRVEPRQLPDLIAAMDVGLAPYGPTAPDWFCPLKVLDYRAAGVPCVASDLGDCAQLLSTGGGVVVSPLEVRTLDDWIGAIQTQLHQPRAPISRPWTDVVSEALSCVQPGPG